MALTISDITRDRVRTAILTGETIGSVSERFGVSKRYVEDQRAILREHYGVIPDSRCHTGSGAEVRRLDGAGWSARKIAEKLGVSLSYVYQQRRSG